MTDITRREVFEYDGKYYATLAEAKSAKTVLKLQDLVLEKMFGEEQSGRETPTILEAIKVTHEVIEREFVTIEDVLKVAIRGHEGYVSLLRSAFSNIESHFRFLEK